MGKATEAKTEEKAKDEESQIVTENDTEAKKLIKADEAEEEDEFQIQFS